MNYFIYILCMLPIFLITPDLKKAIDVYDVAIELSGTWMVVFVALSMLQGPIGRLIKKPILFKSKRPVGLAAFSWLVIHMGCYFLFNLNLVDAFFDLTKPYLLVGLVAAIILTLMAITSTNSWVKRLGKRWNVIHGMGMFAIGLGGAHAIVAQKTIYTVGGQLGIALLVIILVRYAIEIVRS